ncbi:hypothetical protein [Flavobacterium aciduliphilum]|uniref:Uncharacterized protein n=1 Tax=Flavobacterium aciduliphilum TaxID=1101402 RepID=A0A328YFT1_9FLAO|nr:hypothetical protein [Flavobacterium aciduliphilum]RAR70822.1 hypothetical protein CLV55_10973 [Flavobacterium aciduliphilum]
MAKLYTKKKSANSKLLPKKQTIDFILNYSKSMSAVKVGMMHFEFMAN